MNEKEIIDYWKRVKKEHVVPKDWSPEDRYSVYEDLIDLLEVIDEPEDVDAKEVWKEICEIEPEFRKWKVVRK